MQKSKEIEKFKQVAISTSYQTVSLTSQNVGVNLSLKDQIDDPTKKVKIRSYTT